MAAVYYKLKESYIGLNVKVSCPECRLYANLRERDHWGGPDADGRIILRWIFRKWEGVVRNGWCWLLRIATGVGHL